MNAFEERILVIDHALGPDRHLRVHDNDDLVERQTARFVLRQERGFLCPL